MSASFPTRSQVMRCFSGRAAGALAEAAVDALRHVDVVARCAARAVVAARTRFDGDRLRGADRLAELAGDAAFFAVGIAAKRMLAAEARRQRRLLVRIVQSPTAWRVGQIGPTPFDLWPTSSFGSIALSK